jgi:hypothetical protein
VRNFMAAVAAGPTEQRAGEFVDWIDPSPVAEQITLATDLIPDVAAIAAQYLGIGAFARTFWHSKGVDAGVVLPIDPAFYDYWYGPDPVDPTRRACDTHHWPVWIPEGLSLVTLARAGLQFNNDNTIALRQHRNTPTSGGYYIVMRKEVLERNLPEVEQIRRLNNAGYAGLAKAADVAAVLFAINQHDGSRWLGDDTGEENCLTYTRCVERVAYGKIRHPLVVGSFAPSGVNVDCIYTLGSEYIGVAALRKF